MLLHMIGQRKNRRKDELLGLKAENMNLFHFFVNWVQAYQGHQRFVEFLMVHS